MNPIENIFILHCLQYCQNLNLIDNLSNQKCNGGGVTNQGMCVNNYNHLSEKHIIAFPLQ